MDFREIRSNGGNLVKGYGPGELHINEDRYAGSVVLLRESIWTGWLPSRFQELGPEHLTPLVEEDLEVLLLGSGDRLTFPDPTVTAPLIDRGVGVEAMDTPAACRTFNILMSEDRVVAAALFLTEERG